MSLFLTHFPLLFRQLYQYLRYRPGILSDREIRHLAMEHGMIEPFIPAQIRQVVNQKVISFGTSSYGYDLRLSDHDFRTFRHIPGTIIDPKDFKPENVEAQKLHEDANGKFFVLPAHSYGLGVSLERLIMPPNVTGICLGKSTYARVGIVCNITPLESAWEGHLTIELANTSDADCRVYALEGSCQVVFLRGLPCDISYATRHGKYQNQPHEVVLAKV